MSLVFAAITPHPPILIPDIGKENLNKLKATKEALEQMEQDLYVTKPDTIVIISPHGHVFPDVFNVNANPTYEVDLREFGDLTTKGTYQSDMTLALKIHDAAKEKNIPFVLQSEPYLDYGAAVPLFYLTRHLPKIKIVPVNYSMLDSKTHLDFGYLLKEEIMNSEKRAAVIASGDLSHRLDSANPAGFSPDGQKFDDLVIESLKSSNSTALVNLDADLIKNAAECGLRSLLILMGALRHVQYSFKLLSYEHPLGVGHLAAEFVID